MANIESLVYLLPLAAAQFFSSGFAIRSGTSGFVDVVRGTSHFKRKTFWAIHTELGIHTVHGRRSACISPEVKMSKVKVTWFKNALPSWVFRSTWLLKFLVDLIAVAWRRPMQHKTVWQIQNTRNHLHAAAFDIICWIGILFPIANGVFCVCNNGDKLEAWGQG